MIFLVGYMACGKTTLGRALQAAGMGTYVDLDEEVERAAGMSAAEIFAASGEEAFRRAETAALDEVIARSNPATIVGTGGGTPSNGDAMSRMLAAGTVVWLEASLERTVRRLLEADGQRPLTAGMSREELAEFVPRHMAARLPAYARAHMRFDSSLLDTPDEIAATVEAFSREIKRFTS